MLPIIRKSILLGGRQGLKSAWTLLKIMVPVSFAVALLDWTGLLQLLSTAISPAFVLFGLPGSAALAFVSGALLNCYSAIAVMITLPMTGRETTLLALMVLFFHNIPIEAVVQKKAGSSALFMVLYRLAAALLGGVALNFMMPGHAPDFARNAAALPIVTVVPFTQMLAAWSAKSLLLIAKITLLIVGLMTLNRFLEESRAALHLSRALGPLLRLMGLTPETGFLFVVANTLGLAYGGGVIMAEREAGKISDRDIRELNVFIATCHSLLEDTLLFVAIGASAPWITFPRLVIATVAVWAYRALVSRRR
ncbi:MAG: nucleoside recognition domain-containing protein [Fibrobacterota bacterium]